MRTLATDENNDMFLDKKGFAFLEDIDAVSNVVERRLKTQRGELKYATSRGIPWFESIFAGQRNAKAWEAAMKETIKDVDGVISIDTFDYAIENNVVTYQTKFKTIYGGATVNA